MKRLILIMILCFPFMGFSQSKTLTLSLQDAIQKGIANRYDVKAESFNAYLAKNQICKNKKMWIPKISAEGNIQYNTQVRPTFVPKGFVGFTEPQMLSFGAKNQSTFGLSLNQTLFKPGIGPNVKIAKENLALQKEKIRGDKIEVKNAIATAYFDVLLKKLQVQMAQKEENRFETYKTLVKGEYENGVLIKNAYLRAQLDYKNAHIKTQKMQQNYRLALTYLKYQISIPADTKINLSDRIGKISFLKKNTQSKQFLQNRTEIKQLLLKQKENKWQLKRVRQNALPTVALVGYYAELYQNQNFHYEESKWWAPQSYIGLRIDIPITANFSNKNNINKQEIQGKQLEMTLKQRKEDIRFQIQKAETDLQNAQNNMQTAKNNEQLSQTIYKNQQQQFKLGAFQYSDLLDTEKSLHTAEENYIQAVYQYMIAKIAYRKAIGEW